MEFRQDSNFGILISATELPLIGGQIDGFIKVKSQAGIIGPTIGRDGAIDCGIEIITPPVPHRIRGLGHRDQIRGLVDVIGAQVKNNEVTAVRVIDDFGIEDETACRRRSRVLEPESGCRLHQLHSGNFVEYGNRAVDDFDDVIRSSGDVRIRRIPAGIADADKALAGYISCDVSRPRVLRRGRE